MLEFLLEKTDGTKYYYSYFPEGNKNAPGMVVVDHDHDLRKIIKASADDFQNMYAIHAMHGINQGQTSGTVAWY